MHGSFSDWDHEGLMRRCFLVARQARKHGDPPFGALLAKAGEVVITAENTVNTEGDCTAHAEMNLVRRAVKDFGAAVVAGSVLYASTEPCPMCAGAAYWSGIGAVVYGCSAESLARFTGGSLIVPCREILGRGRRPVQVIGPILEPEAITLHRDFW